MTEQQLSERSRIWWTVMGITGGVMPTLGILGYLPGWLAYPCVVLLCVANGEVGWVAGYRKATKDQTAVAECSGCNQLMLVGAPHVCRRFG